MRKNFLLTGITFFVLAAFQSCVKEIDTGNLPVEHKLVIYCMLTPDSLVSVRLSKTNSLLIDDLDSVPGAKVELYENDKFVEILADKGNGRFCSVKIYPVESHSYTIKASAPGFENAEGTDSIPRKVLIQESEKKSWFIHEQNSEQEFVDFMAYFTPINEAGNQYELLFFTQSRREIPGSMPIYDINYIAGSILEADACIADEKYLNSYFSTFVFTDENLDKQRGNVHVKFSYNGYAGSGTYMNALGNPWDILGPEGEYTALRSISKSYYLFRKSYYIYVTKQELFQKWDPSDPFSVLINTNPSDVFSNVKNGYGIVAAYQHSYVRTTIIQ